MPVPSSCNNSITKIRNKKLNDEKEQVIKYSL